METPTPPKTSRGADIWPSGQEPGRHVWRYVIILVVVGVLSAWLAKPLYHSLNNLRATALAKKGEAQLVSMDLPAAVRSLKSALGLAPRSPVVLRFAARYCTLVSAPEALNYWEMFFATGAGTADDQRQFVLYCQDIGRFDLSTPILEKLIANDPGDRFGQLMAIEQAMLVGNAKFAANLARTNLIRFTGDPDFQFAFARAALASGDSTLVPQTLKLLSDLAHGSSSKRFPALRLLATDAPLSGVDADWVVGQLKGQSNGSISDQLLGFDLYGRAHPANRLAVLRDAAALITPDMSAPQDIAGVVGWLQRHGSPALAMGLISTPRAATNETLSMLKIELLTGKKAWPEIAVLLASTNSPLSPTSKALAKAILAAGEKDSGAQDRYLREAHQLGAKNPATLQPVLNLAFALGSTDVGLEIAGELLADSRTRIHAATALLSMARTRDDYAVERLVYHNLGRELGVRAIEERGYIGLLDGEDPAKVKAQLAEVWQAQPDRITLKVVSAFAALKAGDPENALAIIEKDKTNWAMQEQRWLLVYSMVLQANRMRTAWHTAAGQIDRAKLRAPERSLYDELLKSK